MDPNTAGFIADIIFAISCISMALCVMFAIIELGEIINLIQRKDRHDER